MPNLEEFVYLTIVATWLVVVGRVCYRWGCRWHAFRPHVLARERARAIADGRPPVVITLQGVQVVSDPETGGFRTQRAFIAVASAPWATVEDHAVARAKFVREIRQMMPDVKITWPPMPEDLCELPPVGDEN